jgi:predicted nucleotidyltransferase
MDGIKVRETIHEMVRRIVVGFSPEKIILFGSHARGNIDTDSDVDLLVVMHVSGSKRKKAAEIDRALYGTGLPKDVIVVTPEEVEKYQNIVGTVIYPALHEGKVLYERRS